MGEAPSETDSGRAVVTRDLARNDPSMSSKDSAAQNDAANDRRIDSERLRRALTDEFAVEANGPKTYHVRRPGHDDHLVDVETAHCDCEDSFYTEFICIHQIRACVHHAFVSGVDTRLTARVVGAARELGCPHGHGFCGGLFETNSLPCDRCVAASNTGVWTVWCRLSGNTDKLDLGGSADSPVAMTDGGTAVETNDENENGMDELAARLEDAAAKIGDVSGYVEYGDMASELTRQRREIEAVAAELAEGGR